MTCRQGWKVPTRGLADHGAEPCVHLPETGTETLLRPKAPALGSAGLPLLQKLLTDHNHTYKHTRKVNDF